MRRISAALVAVLLAGGLLAGCGEDKPDKKPAPKPTDFSMDGGWDGKPAPKWPKLTQDEKDVYEVVEQTFRKGSAYLLKLQRNPQAAVADNHKKLKGLTEYERGDLAKTHAKTVITLASNDSHVEGARKYPWIVPVSVDLEATTPKVVFDACENLDEVAIVRDGKKTPISDRNNRGIWRFEAVPNLVTPRGNWDAHQWVIVKETKVGQC